MNRFPFAPGVITGSSRLRSRIKRLRRWLVRNAIVLVAVMITCTILALLFGLDGMWKWLLVAANFAISIGMEKLVHAESKRDMEDL